MTNKQNLAESKKRKASGLFIAIFAIIVTALTCYYFFIKQNPAEFNLSGYLKHPDKIPQKVSDLKNDDARSQAIEVDTTIAPQEQKNIQEVKIIKETICIKESYRKLLSEVNFMLINFFQDKPYTEYLNNVSLVFKPLNSRKINNILKNLEDYNTDFLMNTASLTKIVINKESSIVGNFVKIEKETKALKHKEALRKKIINTLDALVEFTYSTEIQNIFINTTPSDE